LHQNSIIDQIVLDLVFRVFDDRCISVLNLISQYN